MPQIFILLQFINCDAEDYYTNVIYRKQGLNHAGYFKEGFQQEYEITTSIVYNVLSSCI